MESLKHQNYLSKLKSLRCFYFFRISTQFLSSVLLFFMILLCSSIYPFIVNSIESISLKMGKNYMFLLCNGILVLIVKNSGLMVSSTSHHPTNYSIKNGGILQKKTEEKLIKKVKKVEIQEQEGNSLVMVQQEQEHEHEQEESIVPRIEQDVDQENQEDNSLVKERNRQDDDDNEEELESSTEEFNKICDDFIRKMKQGIKYEFTNQICT
ncbi:hypothetical protein M5689_018530 [Euphorbia peplus]|nr:hypothetical protein M5689_018530 [Euphorbia peplus]